MNATLGRSSVPRLPSAEYRRLKTTRPSSIALVRDHELSFHTKRRIRINVRGRHFETFQDTLEQYPDTMLGCPTRRIEFYNPVEKQYCLDRDPAIFDSILFYYQSNGILARPECIPENLFNEELEFFGIKTETGDSNTKTSQTKISSSVCDAQSFMEVSPDNNCNRRAIKLRNYCWLMMEYPRLSLAGKIYGKISISVIILSVLVFCLETLPGLNCPRDKTNNQNGTINEFNISENNTVNGSCQLTASGNCSTLAHTQSCNAARTWFVAETALVVFFFMEYLMRIITAPSRCKFVFSFFGLVDAVAITPYFITMAVYGWRSELNLQVTSFTVLRVIRLCRVIRVFKLSRYSDGLKLVGQAFKGTWPTLLSLMLCVLMAVILFSSFLFYAEEDRAVSSIFGGFYWAIITMTTVGYGDVVPSTIIGKLTASACMVFGIVLLLILPLPVFVTHFSGLYEEHIGKKKRAQRTFKFETPTLLEKLMG